MEATHCPKARKIHKVNAIALGERSNVACPPMTRARKSMDQDNRFPFTDNVILDGIALYFDLMYGAFDCYLLSFSLHDRGCLHSIR
jgi:hypothetical protein